MLDFRRCSSQETRDATEPGESILFALEPRNGSGVWLNKSPGVRSAPSSDQVPGAVLLLHSGCPRKLSGTCKPESDMFSWKGLQNPSSEDAQQRHSEEVGGLCSVHNASSLIAETVSLQENEHLQRDTPDPAPPPASQQDAPFPGRRGCQAQKVGTAPGETWAQGEHASACSDPGGQRGASVTVTSASDAQCVKRKGSPRLAGCGGSCRTARPGASGLCFGERDRAKLLPSSQAREQKRERGRPRDLTSSHCAHSYRVPTSQLCCLGPRFNTQVFRGHLPKPPAEAGRVLRAAQATPAGLQRPLERAERGQDPEDGPGNPGRRLALTSHRV